MGEKEHGRNPTQQRMDAEGTDDVPVDVDWSESPVENPESAISGGEPRGGGVSEVIPEDEDRGDEGAIGGATADDDHDGGTGGDDGGPGSQNM